MAWQNDYPKVCPSGVAGNTNRLFLIPHAAIVAAKNAGAVTSEVDGTITGITLQRTGDRAYEVNPTKGAALQPTNPPRPIPLQVPMYNHSLSGILEASTKAARNDIDSLRCSKVVAFVLKNDGTADIVGWEQGLTLTANGYDPSNPNTGNNIPFTVATDEEGPGENYSLGVFFNTDAATTIALFDALKVAV